MSRLVLDLGLVEVEEATGLFMQSSHLHEVYVGFEFIERVFAELRYLAVQAAFVDSFGLRLLVQVRVARVFRVLRSVDF